MNIPDVHMWLAVQSVLLVQFIRTLHFVPVPYAPYRVC